MSKYFTSSIKSENNKFLIYKTGFLNGVFYTESFTKSDFEKIHGKINAYHLIDSCSFRNHDFPFKSRKKIEKVIDFELEPFFPEKNEKRSFVFTQIKNQSGMNSSKALCIGIKDSLLDLNSKNLSENKIEPLGFVPFVFYQAASLARLSYIKEDSIILCRENSDYLTIFSMSPSNILSSRRINFNKTDDIKKIYSALRLLFNYTALSVKTDFNPKKIIVIDSFDSREIIFDKIKDNSLFESELFDLESFKKLVKIKDCDLDISILLFAYELSFSESCIFRKKSLGLKKFGNAYKSNIIISSLIFLTAFFMLTFFTYNEFKSLEKEKNRTRKYLFSVLNENFPGIRKITGSVIDQAKIEILTAQKNNKNTDNKYSKFKKIDVLNTIMSKIPEDRVELDSISIFPLSSSLSGTADGYDVIDSVKNRLSENKMINSVEISMATTDNSGKIRFRLEIKLDE